ncbi:toll/interleukin-1 receptor domain-containing protein [Amycolatopsis sp. NPDC059090]|uniref:toll/interleukin-1 receptor domain-containing protein n=1 Tax=unclassified Amycolatopsis TaxID=2618356 RepID=UPI0036735E65
MSAFRGTVFVNYRVGDEAAVAGLLVEQLKVKLGQGEVFHVSQDAVAGSLFAEEIEGALRQCSVVIVVIGEKWLDDLRHRRLHDPDDWVRREIRLALEGGKRLVPVLIDDATLPAREKLPVDIRALLDHQYRRLHRRSIPQDIDRIVAELIHEVPELGAIRLPGAQELAAWWDTWSHYTDPALPAAGLLAGRAEQTDGILRLLEEPAACTAIQGESEEQALAFLAAVVVASAPESLRALVVDDAEAWSRCVAIARPCVLIPRHEDADISTALLRGHHVLLPSGSDRQPTSVAISLPGLQLDEVRVAFEAAGIAPAFAQSYAVVMCRSLQEFRGRFSVDWRPASEAEPLPSTDREVLANAVTQGPLRHLKVDLLAAEADAMAETEPAEAAARYAKVASVLFEAGFEVHARDIRSKQARALIQAGRLDQSAEVRLDLMWTGMNGTGESAEHLSFADRQNEVHAEGCQFRRALTFARAAERVLTGLTGIREELAGPFDALCDADPHLLDAAVFMAEHALAEMEKGLVEERLNRLAGLALKLETSGSREEDLVVRLSMCIAEVTGEWAELQARAKLFGPVHRIWILARQARYLSFTDDFRGAFRCYQDAISWALTESMNDEAVDWLYALRGIRVRQGLFLANGDTEHPFAQHLRNGTWSHRLPGSPTIEERALRSIGEKRGRGSVRLFSQWRWQACIRADLAGENEATKALGAVLRDNGEPLAGLEQFVRAESGKEAAIAAAALPEAPVHWPVPTAGSTAGQLGAALEVAAKVADLLDDDDAAAWIVVALDAIEGGGPQPTFFSRLVQRGLKVLVSLAPCLDEAQARWAIDATTTWLPQDVSTGHRTDTDHARLLVKIAHVHPALAGCAVEQLLGGAVFNDDFGEVALTSGLSLVEQHKARAVAMLTGPAEAGNRWACSVLAMIGATTDRIREHAEATARAVIEREAPQPGVMPIWSFNTTLVATAGLLDEELMAALVSSLLHRALDPADSVVNRRDTLSELAGIATDLSPDERRRTFDAVLPLVGGNLPMGEYDLLVSGMRHPLSFLHMDLGPDTTADVAVLACAKLAETDEDRQTVRYHAVRLLGRPDEIEVAKIVEALLVVKSSADDLPPALLAAHAHPDVRALAAVLWAQDPTGSEPGLSLARDPARIVRVSLADALTDRMEHLPVREVLAADPRRSIRGALVPLEEL